MIVAIATPRVRVQRGVEEHLAVLEVAELHAVLERLVRDAREVARVDHGRVDEPEDLEELVDRLVVVDAVDVGGRQRDVVLARRDRRPSAAAACPRRGSAARPSAGGAGTRRSPSVAPQTGEDSRRRGRGHADASASGSGRGTRRRARAANGGTRSTRGRCAPTARSRARAPAPADPGCRRRARPRRG